MDLTIKARAEVNRFFANGEKVPEGKKVVSIVLDHVEDPNRPGHAWPAVKLATHNHGGRIEFVTEEAALRDDPLLSNFEPGRSYQIIIPVQGNQ